MIANFGFTTSDSTRLAIHARGDDPKPSTLQLQPTRSSGGAPLMPCGRNRHAETEARAINTRSMRAAAAFDLQRKGSRQVSSHCLLSSSLSSMATR
jgi:hypothetical protein